MSSGRDLGRTHETATEEHGMTPDLEPAARQLAKLVEGVDPQRLDAPTPCPDYTLGDLLEHVGGLALAFTWAARKEFPEGDSQAPAGDASRLPADWQTTIPRDLLAMADAWRAPDAWTGMTQAGGIDLPGEVAGIVALDELVIHGWDVARASGQDFVADETSLTAIQPFVASFAEPGAGDSELFGAPVPVPDGAPLQDRVIGLTGRDPNWSPATA
jgi:uncharacterized protein (TIGR03086 family)